MPEEKLGLGNGLMSGGAAGGQIGLPPPPQPKYPRQTLLGAPEIRDSLSTKFRRWYHAEKIDGKRLYTGLVHDLEMMKDPRDFRTDILGLGAYVPQHPYLLKPSVSVKNQGAYGTCQWNDTAAQKEDDENVSCSPQSLVIKGKTMGLVGTNGVSSLQSGQLVLKNWGIAEERFFSDPDMIHFDAYSDARLLTPEIEANAATHKIQSFWSVIGRSDTLRFLDQGKTMSTGMMWFSGFNMGGGFSYPWIIREPVGVPVEGHAFKMKGYVQKYLGIDSSNKLITGAGGVDVYVFQNSYGESWGATVIDDNGVVHKGLFFVTMDYFDGVGYSRYTNLDIAKNIGAFLTQYTGQNVKGMQPGIFLIKDGKKCAYPDWVTFLAYGFQKGKWAQVDQADLDAVPVGPAMDITLSPYWDMIKGLSAPDNMNRLLEIISQK